MKPIAVLLSIFFAAPAVAQLSVEQRAFDFQALASLYAKRYAPLSWKRQVFNIDITNIAPWLTRVRAAKDDIEFLELCKEYVSSFDDLHTSFSGPGDLIADSGLFTDIYDGKVYVDAINRTMLPRASFAIETGDEVISIDGKPVEEALNEIIRLQKMGNPSTTRRFAAELLTFRPASDLPRTVLLGDSVEVELKQADGETRKFTLPWVKRGFAPVKIGPVPSPRTAAADGDAPTDAELLLRAWNRNAQWKAPANNAVVRRFEHLEKGSDQTEGWVLGWGSRAPTFTAPAGFQQRLGRSAGDFHYSGTYLSDGKRIGYLRIPNFQPPSAAGAQRELAGEIAFFRLNTDGLVVDVSRNTGGGCYVLTAASYLIPQRFWFFGEESRPTIDLISGFQSTLELAKRFTESNYDFKAMVRDICRSEAYQRSTEKNPSNDSDERNFAHQSLRRIKAESMLDILSQVTNTKDKFPQLPLGARAVQITDGATSNYFLTTFGRATRETACSCEVKMEPTLSQALHLLNGDTSNAKIQQGGILAAMLTAKVPPEQIIERLYIRCVSRKPTPEEFASLKPLFVEGSDPKPALDDIFWALLNSREFLFNH